ncbi:MAG: translation elongation factor Ts [Spirochaetales bacterium]|uniref:Elongation factor Ts n=1 Tax=Candidatus Thalassospirochaeta sargassi TaxID=3119039 RepID=A0AAJ1ID86_9SPIO|nr:translation elongation factor Ts [Spirochaetales bacterium]
MADVKPADVKKLRDKTGAGMLDCKKALVEAEGDFAKAEKLLKEQGLAAAAKRGDRATNEGRIFTKIADGKAAILELACETDFVAINENFVNAGKELVEAIVADNLTEITPDLEEKVKLAISKLKENMSIKRFKSFVLADNEFCMDYIHGEGGIGVLVKLSADDKSLFDNDAVKEFAFDCALHIAAFNPLYLSKEVVDEAYTKEQTEIFMKQAENLGKPEKVLQGIVKGKLNKHFAQICLLDQPFVKDDKNSLANVLASVGKEAGGKLKIEDFVYYRVGEEV